MVWGMGFLAAGSVVLGIAPQLAVNYLLNPILRALGLGAGVHVTWLGLSADAGSFSTTGGLVLAVVSLVLGGAIYVVAYVARPAGGWRRRGAGRRGGGGIFTGGEPLSDQGRLTAGDFSEIFQQNWKSFFRWTNVDRVYLGVWERVAGGFARAWRRGRLDGAAARLALVVVLAAAIFALVRWVCLEQPPGARDDRQPRCHMPPLSDRRHRRCRRRAAVSRRWSAARKAQIPLWPCMLVVGGLIGWRACWSRIRGCALGCWNSARCLTVVRGLANSAHSRRQIHLPRGGSHLCAIDVRSDTCSNATRSRRWSRALLLTSICVKLAAVPMFFWLLSLADELPALVLGLIIAVVDMAAFGEF